jgi:hypothetical protein
MAFPFLHGTRLKTVGECRPDTLSQIRANDDRYPQLRCISIRPSAAQVFLGFICRYEFKREVPLT